MLDEDLFRHHWVSGGYQSGDYCACLHFSNPSFYLMSDTSKLKLKGLPKACVGWGVMGWVHSERKGKGCSSCPKDHCGMFPSTARDFVVLFPVVNGFKVNSRTDEKENAANMYILLLIFFFFWSWIYNHGSDAWKTYITAVKEWNLQHTVRSAAAHAPEAR